MWKTVCVVWCGLNLVLSVLKVEGVRLTIDPENSVTLYKVPTSIDQKSRIFTCGTIQANPADIKASARLSITRMTKREVNSGATAAVTIALVLDGDPGRERPYVVDIQDRNRVPDDGIAGKIDKLDYRQSFLSIKFNTVAMKCDDAGEYFCNLNYLDNGYNLKSEIDSMNLTVSAIPDRVSLIGQPEPRRTGDGSENYPFQMKKDDVIEFTCSGRIGGDQNTQWEWKKTGENGSLIKLVPSSMMCQNRVNETRGPAVPVDAECTNTRTTTLRYTITEKDENTKVDKIQFQCYTESQGANVSSRFVYMQVEGVLEPTSTNGGSLPVLCTCKDCDAEQKAAIVGGCMSVVIAFLLAALVYILIRQQKCLQTKGNTAYETPQRLGDATLTYDTLQQPGDSYEVPERRNPHTYTNTNI